MRKNAGWPRVLVGTLALISLYWVFEAAMDANLFGKGDFLHTLVTPQGNELWMRLTFSALVAALVAGDHYFRLRTRRLEEARKCSEEKFSKVFHTIPDSVTLSRMDDGTILEVNEGFSRLSGYSPEEAVGRSSIELGLWPSARDRERFRELLVSRGAVREFETDLARKDGSLRTIALSATPLEVEGQKLVLVNGRDVTEKRKAEEELRQSEQLYRSAYSMTPLAFVLWAPDCRVLDWNRRAEEMFGWSREEVLGNDFFEFLIPAGEKPAVQGLVGAILEKRQPTFSENRNATKDGRILVCEWYTSPLYGADNQVAGILSLGLDVTERKRAEERVASVAKFPAENPYPVMRIDKEGVLLYANESSQALLREWGCAVGETVPTFLLLQVVESISKGGDRLMDLECGARTYSFIVTPIGQFGYVNLYGQDVTDRKRAEQALRESEEKHRGLYEAVSGGVVMQDRDGKIVEANAAACEILGLTPDQMRGLTSADPRWRTVREDGSPFPAEERPLALALRTGKPVRGVISGVFNPALGQHRWLMSNAEPILDIATGQVRAAVATFWDITERKEAEELVRAALQEKEVLLREIHHRVKNNLQVISTLLDLRGAGISDPVALKAFQDSKNRVRAMALIHERLYQSASMARMDFRSYITDLMAHLFRVFGVDPDAVQLSLEVEDAPVGVDTAIPVGLILNELVSNSLKYGFPAGRQGRIRIRLQRHPDQALELTVEDDGVGLPPEVDFKNTESLGLQLVCILVRQLGGEIERAPGPGASFRMTFKESAGRHMIPS